MSNENNTVTTDQTGEIGEQQDNKESGQQGQETKSQEKMFTQSELNSYIAKAKKEAKEKATKDFEEAKKLESMTQEEQKNYEINKLKEELATLKEKNTLSEMGEVARNILQEKGVIIPDSLVNAIITTDANTTKENIENFSRAYLDAVQQGIKASLKGKTPTSGTSVTMSKEDILKVEDRALRQKLINENIKLWRS